MSSKPPSVPSSIQDAQRTRVVVDAIVQAGLSARIAYSLAGGLAGQAHRSSEDALTELVQPAQEAAERAKNADMSLDMVFVENELDAADALRKAGKTLERAAEAFEVAARVHEAMDADSADAAADDA